MELPCPCLVPLERSGTAIPSESHQTVFSCFLPSDFMFIISDWDTRIDSKELLQKEDVSENLESQVEISENCTSDVSLAPELGELCEDVLERDWGVPDDTSQMQSLF